MEVEARYTISKGFSASLAALYKTSGWMIGNPYLDDKFSFRIGVRYDLVN